MIICHNNEQKSNVGSSHGNVLIGGRRAEAENNGWKKAHDIAEVYTAEISELHSQLITTVEVNDIASDVS